MPIYEFEGIRPVIDSTAYVHPTAVIIGDVIIGAMCFIGPCAVIRGDVGRLIVGNGTNIQDGCIVHSFPGEDTVIAEDGHIGHGAVIHGCTIGKNSLIGMNSVVMDGAEVGESCIVGAMSFVKAAQVIPPRSLAAGSPAKIIRSLREEEIAWKSEGTDTYKYLAKRHAQTTKECEPLSEVEIDRARVPQTSHGPKHKQ
ncbi:MAG: hypothetical protein QGI78_04350 [Phycisphaerales bacterium]|jgi:phenylacetic acid degradation protein|nr:hypothetical protein [Phycisphaerales bacterium]